MIPCGCATPSPTSTQARTSEAFKPFKQVIPAAAIEIDMAPIHGDTSKSINPLWISTTEITWDVFDVFIYKLDEPTVGEVDADSAKTADAATRPTKPYLPPDRGFGHEGFAAITMSHHNAEEFCKWLSAKTGRHYRLPTEDEWEFACMANDSSSGGDEMSNGEKLGDTAWFGANSDGAPHHVALKKPNAWGLYDMRGNVAEWVDGRDGRPVLKGGSYRDSADHLNVSQQQPYDRAWNASDPQVPKSEWWLADGPFVGFRIVCDDPKAANPTGNMKMQGAKK